MKVLLLGATGNLGSRLVPALLLHGHTVVAYVRSTKKLEGMLPQDILHKLTMIQGDATDKLAIKQAILDHNCDTMVNTAGLAAILPWNTSDLPIVLRAEPSKQP